MPTATANGLPVLRAEVVETYQGNWVAALDVDSNEVLSGALELVIGEITWRGTIVPGRSGLDGGHVRVIVEGGAGGLRQELGCRFFSEPTLETLVADLMRETGETAASDSDDLRTFVYPRWLRTACWAAGSLTTMCDVAGLTWRMKRDGTLWVGKDTWPEVKPQATEILPLPGIAEHVFAVPSPEIRPGTTFRGERISTALTQVGPSALRQEVWIAGT